ncbi:MAG: LacI family transcriptional regulator [Clostridia bacterium]|nr:LacI family transcriptional regulator [Clostridia bacterium]
MRDVAKQAGVSPATVSRYFHGKTIVTEDAARRIEAAVRKLEYVPVYKQKNPGVIAVLLPNLKLAYFSEVLKELLEAVPRYGYRMVFIPITDEGEGYKHFFKELDITGVIYLEENADQNMLNYIAAKNIQTVMFGVLSEDKRCKMVHINDLAAAREGARYLLSLQHEQILILSDHPKSISSGFQRITGCKRAFEEYGLEFDESKVKYGELTYDSGYRMTSQAIKEGIPFTAAFAFSDEAALGVISALSEANLRVPEDVSVLGFDGISLSRQVTPKLSTISQPIKKMVEQTLDTFQSHKKEEDIEITLPYRLEPGETCIVNSGKKENENMQTKQ